MIKAWCWCALSAAALLGCGGGTIGDGDYVVLQVAYGQAKQNAACKAPNDVTTTVDTSGTIVVYGTTNSLFADVGTIGQNGDVTLKGSAGADQAYNFSGKTTATQQMPQFTLTQTGTYTLDLKYDGKDASGSLVVKYGCSGSGGACNFAQPPDGCTTTVQFNGVKVDSSQHDI
jgi:hypothetical protein